MELILEQETMSKHNKSWFSMHQLYVHIMHEYMNAVNARCINGTDSKYTTDYHVNFNASNHTDAVCI